ncbi:MAG: penicillin-binding protein activator [Rhizobiaceae bacterium]
MSRFSVLPRSVASIVVLTITALLLASCQQNAFQVDGSSAGRNGRLATDPGQAAPLRPLSAEVNGEKVGTGPVRVAMILPKTASGAAGIAGSELANAAKMAMRDFAGNRFQLVIKDTKGQPAEASILAAQARDEGASLVLGPLFSANVSSASGVTEPAKIPMIAFSSDIARARPGVYLLSFAPDADIRRTLSYGYSLGANRVVALLPESSYGRLAERELRRTYDRLGAEIVTIIRYKRNSDEIVSAARSAVLPLANANAIYIPEGGRVPALILDTLKKSGIDLTSKQIMGSGQWTSTSSRDSVLNGAIYAGADKTGFTQFATRYKTLHGNEPSITAALGYDAISLASELLRRSPQSPFTASQIQSRGGFRGATGIFRFEADGRLQRALVVNRIDAGQPIIVSPAPSSFGR